MSFYGFRRWQVDDAGQLLPVSLVHVAPAWSRDAEQPPSTCLCNRDLLSCDEHHPYPQTLGRCGYYLHQYPIVPCVCGDANAGHGALGVVRGWGRYVQHQRGVRVQRAQILGLVDFTGRVTGYPATLYPDVQTLYSEWAPEATRRPSGSQWAKDRLLWCEKLLAVHNLYYGSSGLRYYGDNRLLDNGWPDLLGDPLPCAGTLEDIHRFGQELYRNLTAYVRMSTLVQQAMVGLWT